MIEKTRLYVFVTQNRLTEAEYLVGVLNNEGEVFGMDDLGNRTTVNLRSGANQVYATDTPNITNRYTALGGQPLVYDAAGNLTQDHDGYRYVYDYENRITRIFKLNGQTEIDVAQYAYDALGRRIRKITYDSVPSVATYYYYNDQWQILDEYVDGNWRGGYTYGNYIDEVLSVSSRPRPNVIDFTYFAHDHLYSPAAKTLDDIGGVYRRYEYDAYGKVTITARGADNLWYTADDVTVSASQPFAFTGRQLDILDSGNLHHMHYRHRDYSPQLGRFLQHDPLGVIPKNDSILVPFIQFYDGMSIYEFVLSNPIVGIDPLGLLLYRPFPPKPILPSPPFGTVCGSGRGAGWVPDNPLGHKFASACQNHDDCYEGKGPSGCDADRKDCDEKFLEDMKQICLNGPMWKYENCRNNARIYYWVVRIGGGVPFDNARQGPPCNNESPCSSGPSDPSEPGPSLLPMF